MLIMSLGCLQFSRESCLLYAFFTRLSAEYFLRFIKNILKFSLYRQRKNGHILFHHQSLFLSVCVIL